MRLAPPTPFLPVPDVEAAQAYYRDRLGFEIDWYNEEGRIGGVANGDCVIFFRAQPEPAAPAIFYIFAEDVDAAHEALTARGAEIVEPLEDKHWGLRQFTVQDAWGNRFHVFCDL
ncbi:VOC family protein [Jannaschia marina]|uniref:VOC family protein n=1 Tax=Jannaschia marina TaxID=2741674 RepID=UPI0015C98496|nr:VOC family protein [Jannaschia marina]